VLCPTNCDQCSAAGCTLCSAGSFLNSAGVCDCLTSCLAYANADPSCLDCAMLVNATDNTSTLLCNACKQRTFVASNEYCNACPSSCATCLDYLTCLTCLPSFTLLNGNCVCDATANDVTNGTLCYNCAQLMEGCIKCSLAGTITTCSVCMEGWGLDAGICYYCGIGCKQCSVALTVPTCLSCDSTYSLVSPGCSLITTCDNNLAVYYDPALPAPSCAPCIAYCQVCYDGVSCVACQTSFTYLHSKCVCNAGLGLFLDLSVPGGTCISCQSNAYLQFCEICQSSTANYANGIECFQCMNGYFLSAGTCVMCMSGCQKCSTNSTCCSCDTPSWMMVNGTCMCNNGLNYFFDGISSCLPCTIANCSVCDTLTSCLLCNIGLFINSSGLCQQSVCGNGVVEGIE
jgi:hypothetical protein